LKVRELVWSIRALTELDEIIAYIRGQDPVTAQRVAARIDERVGSLLLHPRLGRRGRVAGTRELVVAPFIVAYEVTDDLIVVLAVLRARRRWPRSFSRRPR
jgi:toxin ParE1/3/4